jgi:phage gpG-like protein
LSKVIKPLTSRGLRFYLGGRLVIAGAVTIPARPYLGFGEADRVVVMDAVAFSLNGAMAGYSARQLLSRS